MRDYELIVIYKPEITEENLPPTIEGVSKFITDRGGAITEVNRWGRRKLAYAIKGVAEGSYVLTRFKGGPKLISALESNLKMSEVVLRHLVVRSEGLPPPAAPPAAPAAAPAEAAPAPPVAAAPATAPARAPQAPPAVPEAKSPGSAT